MLIAKGVGRGHRKNNIVPPSNFLFSLERSVSDAKVHRIQEQELARVESVENSVATPVRQDSMYSAVRTPLTSPAELN